MMFILLGIHTMYVA